ncbi:hypothetical protein GY45DRAFT_1317405 [Cubamyces sp. BRFM 1775]|nr:hypothetical protein GY45DRAFT_1317405 [Cubamyces sp. BRFM 1775]
MTATSSPSAQLDDTNSAAGSPSGYEYEGLFSPPARPTLQVPSPGPSRLSPAPQQGEKSPSQPLSSASSPPSTSTSVTTDLTTDNSHRKSRPKIALAPGQPPTARGNDRIRVYVACHECRARKIRCDGGKPMCLPCQRRPSRSGVCTYDAAPNRKGHRRRKAASEGTPKGKAKKRRRTASQAVASGSTDDSDSSTDTETHGSRPHSSAPSGDDEHRGLASDSHAEDFSEYDPFAFDPDRPELFLLPEGQSGVLLSSHQIPEELEEDEEDAESSLPSRPSVKFTRDTWWDALLAFYAFDRDPMSDTRAVALTAEQRHLATRYIVSDLRALFQSATSWMSFIHLPRFFEMVLNPARRVDMQPSLLFSALALGTLAQSSEMEKGRKGRQRAMKLLDMAHSALQSSLATGWVDVGLAQAGWLILYFEFNSHPEHAWDRLQSALSLLDSLVRLLSLTTLDTGYQRVGVGPLHTTPSGNLVPHTGMASMASSSSLTSAYPIHPTMEVPSQLGTSYPLQHSCQATQPWNPQPTSQTFDATIPDPLYMGNTPYSHIELPQMLQSATADATDASYGFHRRPSTGSQHRGCDCARFSLGQHWPTVREFAPAWAATPMWPTNIPEAEFKKEECRRLIWSSVYMIGSLHAFANKAPSGGVSTIRMFVKEHDSFALLTPSQTLMQAGVPIEADDVWSLTLRLMLLFHSSVRMRVNPAFTNMQRAEFTVRTWLEIDDIERRMRRHTCGMLSHYGFHSAELLLRCVGPYAVLGEC